jgi:hypothetical protein
MKNLKIALSAATALTVAVFGLGSLLPTSVAMNAADCPEGWNWNYAHSTCVPPGLPADPPNGCLTGDGTHLNGTICAN